MLPRYRFQRRLRQLRRRHHLLPSAQPPPSSTVAVCSAPAVGSDTPVPLPLPGTACLPLQDRRACQQNQRQCRHRIGAILLTLGSAAAFPLSRSRQGNCWCFLSFRIRRRHSSRCHTPCPRSDSLLHRSGSSRHFPRKRRCHKRCWSRLVPSNKHPSNRPLHHHRTTFRPPAVPQSRIPNSDRSSRLRCTALRRRRRRCYRYWCRCPWQHHSYPPYKRCHRRSRPVRPQHSRATGRTIQPHCRHRRRCNQGRSYSW